MLAWAGAIDEGLSIDTSILHLAPVARETPSHWAGRADFVGLTPQGLVREWSGRTGEISHATPDPGRIPESWDALVMSEHERASCETLISKSTRQGAVVAVTAYALANLERPLPR